MVDITVVAARFGEYASTLVLFGSAMLFASNARAQTHGSDAVSQTPRRLVRVASVIALLCTLAFLMAETASLTGVARDAIDADSLWAVVSTTQFGALTAVRIGILLGAALASFTLAAGRALWMLESALGACVVASYAWTGHGALDEGAAGVAHLGADVVHLLAAGVWVGALVWLAHLIARAIGAQTIGDAQSAAGSLVRFSRVGPALIAVLALSGLVNAWYLIGPGKWPALFTSAYGRVLLAKLVVFTFMLGFAGINRLWLTPRLTRCIRAGDSPAPSLRSLRRSVTSEALLAALVLALVSVLGVLEPPRT